MSRPYPSLTISTLALVSATVWMAPWLVPSPLVARIGFDGVLLFQGFNTAARVLAMLLALGGAYLLGRRAVTADPRRVATTYALAGVAATVVLVAVWWLTLPRTNHLSFAWATVSRVVHFTVPFVLAGMAGMPLGARATVRTSAAGDGEGGDCPNGDGNGFSLERATRGARQLWAATLDEADARTVTALFGAALVAVLFRVLGYLFVVERDVSALETNVLLRSLTLVVVTGVTVAVAYDLGRRGSLKTPGAAVVLLVAGGLVAKLSVAVFYWVELFEARPSVLWFAFLSSTEILVNYVLAGLAGIPLGARAAEEREGGVAAAPDAADGDPEPTADGPAARHDGPTDDGHTVRRDGPAAPDR